MQGSHSVNEYRITPVVYMRNYPYMAGICSLVIRVISYILAHNIGRKCRLIFFVSNILSTYCSNFEYVKPYQLKLILKILIANIG